MKEALEKRLEQVEEKLWDMEMGTIRPHMWTEYHRLDAERASIKQQLKNL